MSSDPMKTTEPRLKPVARMLMSSIPNLWLSPEAWLEIARRVLITVERDREFFDAGMAHASALAVIASYNEDDDDAFQFAKAAIEKGNSDEAA